MTSLTIGSRDVEVSRIEKTLFPEAGITKGDVVDYYGCDDEATLAYLANQGVITLHGWLSRRGRLDRPDRLLFDLDPPRPNEFRAVVAAARGIRGLMREIGLTPCVMTTGSKGLHVVAPLDASGSFEDARAVSRSMAGLLAERNPDTLTTEQRKDERSGRVYLDVTRNAWGQTSVLPYALRARPGAPVATPLDWTELARSDLGPQRFGLANVRRRLGQKPDPWATIERHASSLERARRIRGGASAARPSGAAIGTAGREGVASQ